MLKAKNIIIIFILNYLIMLIACCLIEFVLVSSTAQQIHLMVTTAADMALEQVQATDDFFTSGNGYIIENNNLKSINNPYKMQVLGKNGKYEAVNIFEAVCNTNNFDNIYKKLYNSTDIQKYVNDIKANGGDVLDVDFLVARTTMDTSNYIDTNISTRWFRVPVLAQLGDTTHGGVAKRVLRVDNNMSVDSLTAGEIWTMYDLASAGKETRVNGTDTKYYYTPLSVGLTYINEDLLQAFFMNNLELLMRGKYELNPDYDLNSEKFGNGMLKTTIYPDLVDTETLEDMNPINNGSFTLLRGERIPSDTNVYLYEGIKPKIEYIVIDMYDDRYNDILQMVLGAKTTGKQGLSKQTVTGSNLKEIDREYLNTLHEITGQSVNKFENKPIVVAKVTFYAEFIVPYTTPLLREMRGRIRNNDNDTMRGRTLFNAFEYSTINQDSIDAIDGNYVDIATGDGSSLLSLGSNSEPYSYTTYFAVTP